MKRQEELAALRAKVNGWEEKSRAARKRIAALELEADRKKYNCNCVKLNRDIGIHDMGELCAAGRDGVPGSAGLVSSSLSLLANCPHCHGTGRV